MIVMIIFLVSSVLFIIGTVIYVKRKDKRNITTSPLPNAGIKEKKADRKKDKKKAPASRSFFPHDPHQADASIHKPT